MESVHKTPNVSGGSSLSYAETVEAPLQVLELSDSPGSLPPQVHPEPVRRRMALLEGSQTELSQETLNVLQDRLRIVATLLSGGFAAFLIWILISPAHYLASHSTATFWAHVAVTVLLALVAQRMIVGCDDVRSHLRFTELMVFGAPAIFFLWSSYEQLIRYAELTDGHSHIPRISAAWLLLIFSYAVFIPNKWQRAMVVLGLMGLAPVLVLTVAYFTSTAFAELLHTAFFRDVFIEQMLATTLMVVVGTVGVRTIGDLRQEAFTAKQLGQYRLRQMLGSGGMGEVYLAEHHMMKRPCAIKIIRPEKAGDPKVAGPLRTRGPGHRQALALEFHRHLRLRPHR